jgi:hypothetical protein
MERERASAERTLAELGPRSGVRADLRNGRITLPNGRTLSASDLGNPQALAAAGLSPDQIQSLGDIMKQIDSAAQRAVAARGGLDRGSSGEEFDPAGGGRAGAAGEAPILTAVTTMQRGPSSANPTGNVKAEGLRKMFNGEPIGTANDNLFAQISRRYDVVARRGDVILDP